MKSRTPRILGLAAFAAVIVPSLAAAQGPATVRGVVYSCRTGSPLESVPVTLRSLTDGAVIRLSSDARGRFVRVGVPPGRYLIGVAGVVPRAPGMRESVTPASRLARLESDDVLDVVIGTDVLHEISRHNRIAYSATLPVSDEPRPLCDAPAVPPAPSTTDRYIIH
jgi:hypothetical protein